MPEQRSMTYAEKLSTLIRVETISRTEQKDKSKFREFHKVLRETFPLFFSNVKCEEYDGSLLIQWKGSDSNLEPVMFMNHHDVVEAKGRWKYGPFFGAIAEEKVWGRGTLDTKGGLCMMLQAAEELMNSGFIPKRDTYFVSTCTEETDGSGARVIAEQLERRKIHFHMILDEGGMILYDPIGGADGTFAMVGVTEKSAVDMKFIAKSKGGHASTPGKDTPLVRLGKFMAEVENKQIFDTQLTPLLQDMLVRFSVHMKGIMKLACGHPVLFKGILEKIIPSISATTAAMTRTTIAFTMASGSDEVNVIPHEAWVMGDMRCSPHQGNANSIEAITKIAAKYDVETIATPAGKEAAVTDYNGEVFKKLENAVEQCFPGVKTVPYIMTGVSDSRFFSHLTDNSLRFVPFFIDDQQFESIHGVDENVNIKTLAPAVDFYKYMMKEV